MNNYHLTSKFQMSNVKCQMSNESGQTLIELIVVILVSTLVIGALVFATIASLRNAQFAKNQAQATKLAQEGIELVRTGRDRDLSINNIPPVVTWDGDSNSGICTGTTNINADSIWCYQINSTCSNILNPNCYFNVTSTGVLNYFINGLSFPEIGSQSIPPNFKRAVIISDDDDYASQKTVTVIVAWTDFSGPHESRLTTILRKL